MRKKISSLNIAALLLVVSLGLTVVIGRSFAATGQLYLSPASKSVQQNATFGLDLRLNPGATVDGVEATVTFDSSKLQVMSVDTTSSAFTVQLSQSTGSSTVSLARGNLSGGVSSDAKVAVINFKALVASGNTSVSVSGNATAAGSYTNPATSGTSVSFTAPPTTGGGSSGGGSGSTGSGSSGSTTPKPSTPTSTTPTGPNPTTPQQTNSTPSSKIEAAPAPQYTRTAVKVSCDGVKTFVVKYGLDKDNLNLQTEVLSQCGKEVPISSLVGGTTYYYQVVATDASGKQTTTDVKTFKTKGYTVRIKVVGQDGKPLRKQKVTLHSDPIETTTDNDGVAQFTDVPAGTHRLVYKVGKNELSQTVQVAEAAVSASGDAQTATVQNFSVAYKATAKSPLPLIVGSVAVVALAIVGAAYILRKRNAGFAHLDASPTGTQVIVGGTGFAPVMTAPQPMQPPRPQTQYQPQPPQAPGQPTVIAPAPPAAPSAPQDPRNPYGGQ